jgi:hydroxymethylpyrimidine pyrophosphatase-like HAD family hydrolase
MTREDVYTIFLDIDGTLLPNPEHFEDTFLVDEVLPGTHEKLLDWHRKGYKIILTTGRPSTYRHQTLMQLNKLGILYDQLVMDCGCGPRVLVNDVNPFYPDHIKARSINLTRNTGIGNIQLP